MAYEIVDIVLAKKIRTVSLVFVLLFVFRSSDVRCSREITSNITL